MITQQAIYRTADEMIRMSGFSTAKEEAVKFANDMADKHDDEGRKIWLRVCAAIEEMETRH